VHYEGVKRFRKEKLIEMTYRIRAGGAVCATRVD
jgi:hypothetical protein